MRTFIFLICLIVATKYHVSSLGETSNFNDFQNMVLGNISATTSYQIPKDNSALLNVTDPTVNYYGSYDFIIIGSGAGAVIANRLTEIRKCRVLLLDAGGEANDFTKILGLAPYTWLSDFSWGYNSTVQKNACLGFDNQQCRIPQGKIIGGSTTIGAGVYDRGHPEDCNRLVNVYGNPGWSYSEVFPYFIKSEKAVFQPRDSTYHGIFGYVTINQTSPGTPGMEPALIKGFAELGVPNSIDYNGRVPNSISKSQFTLKGNERVSTATAFLNNFRNRPNLDISLNSFVTNLLIDQYNRTYGVSFVKNGQIYIAEAEKEVILSAGVYNSPQIMMISGIGPKDHLTKLGIKVRKDLPVGKNLQDQVMFIGFYLRSKNILHTANFTKLLQQYVRHERPLTAGINVEMLAHINDGQNQNRRAEIEIFVIAPSLNNESARIALGLNNQYTAAFKLNSSTDIWMDVINLHPKSRGTVTLKSKNPRDKPIIDPNYLAEQDDIEKLYEGIQLLIKLNNTDALKQYGAKMLVLDYPNCEPLGKLSKAWWLCAIKHLTANVAHPVGTNSMGPDPKTSVVNARLKVHGIKRLRIADASVVPETTSGYIMSTVLMLAEKASDMIKEDWGI